MTPRRLGSAARVPRIGCAAINSSVAACTSARGRGASRSSRKGTASGCLTLRKCSRSASSRAASLEAAASASSGVSASITAMMVSTSWGKAWLNAARCCRQGRLGESSSAVSVVMAKFRAV